MFSIILYNFKIILCLLVHHKMCAVRWGNNHDSSSFFLLLLGIFNLICCLSASVPLSQPFQKISFDLSIFHSPLSLSVIVSYSNLCLLVISSKKFNCLHFVAFHEIQLIFEEYFIFWQLCVYTKSFFFINVISLLLIPKYMEKTVATSCGKYWPVACRKKNNAFKQYGGIKNDLSLENLKR